MCERESICRVEEVHIVFGRSGRDALRARERVLDVAYTLSTLSALADDCSVLLYPSKSFVSLKSIPFC